MSSILKLLKMVGLFLGLVIVLFLVLGFFFINFYPSFGGKLTREQREQFAHLDHYQEGKFVNQIETEMSFDMSSVLSMIRDYFRKDTNRQPSSPLPVESVDSLDLTQPLDDRTRITWFGHSAILLETGGRRIMLDPMLGESPAPHPWLGTQRYSEKLPISIDQLPPLDAVIFSHDHYDHLDYPSVRQLKDKVNAFYVPLGVGAHLRAWGVEESKIHELNWWDTIQHENLRLVCTPARHFSGRGVFDRNRTLWASWIISSPTAHLYFSGDSGYGPHFKEIGEKYGPFDLAMMECGQYDLRWEAIHMLPEQTAQAFTDVQGKLLIPIHWGAFTLALHAWTDPVERITASARERNITLVTPRIGEPVVLPKQRLPTEAWWESVQQPKAKYAAKD